MTKAQMMQAVSSPDAGDKRDQGPDSDIGDKQKGSMQEQRAE